MCLWNVKTRGYDDEDAKVRRRRHEGTTVRYWQRDKHCFLFASSSSYFVSSSSRFSLSYLRVFIVVPSRLRGRNFVSSFSYLLVFVFVPSRLRCCNFVSSLTYFRAFVFVFSSSYLHIFAVVPSSLRHRHLVFSRFRAPYQHILTRCPDDIPYQCSHMNDFFSLHDSCI